MGEFESVAAFLAADGLPEAASAPDALAFRIDGMMRVVKVPEGASVLGVEGDKDVNRVVFRAPRMYRGEDLSLFEAQVNYANAGGELGVYPAGKPVADGDEVEVSWLVGEPAVRYKGDVSFSVRFFVSDGRGEVSKSYSTAIATARCLDGLDVDKALPEDRLASLVEQLTGLTEASAAKADAAADAANAARDAAVAAANDAGAALAQLPLPTGNVLRGEAAGKLVRVADAFPAPPLGASVFGASAQGTKPTPPAPKPIASIARAELRLSAEDAAVFDALAIDLAGNELRGIPGGARDEVTIDSSGAVELVKRVGCSPMPKVESVGADNSQQGSDGTYNRVICFKPPENAAVGNGAPCMCTHFPDGGTSKNRDTIRFGANNSSVYVYTADAGMIGDGTGAAVDAWVEKNGVHLLYRLAKPQTVSLGRVELPTLAAPVAKAWAESDVPAESALRYMRDVTIVVEAIEASLAAQAGNKAE